jgi:hypothetical protein
MCWHTTVETQVSCTCSQTATHLSVSATTRRILEAVSTASSPSERLWSTEACSASGACESYCKRHCHHLQQTGGQCLQHQFLNGHDGNACDNRSDAAWGGGAEGAIVVADCPCRCTPAGPKVRALAGQSTGLVLLLTCWLAGGVGGGQRPQTQ